MTSVSQVTPAHRRRAAALALLATLVLAGCSAGSADSGADGSVTTADDVSGAEAGDGPADGTEQVVRTADALLTADDPVAAGARVVALVTRIGGHVDDLHQWTGSGDDPGRVDLTVRVPSEDMATMSDRLAEVGTVEEFSLRTENVTAAVRDLDARISATELSVARMSDLLARSTTSRELIEAEQALTQRQGDLERLRSERAALADRVSLSTLHVVVGAPAATPRAAGGTGTFLDGLGSGWRGFVLTVQVVLHVVGVLLPWLVAAGAVTGVTIAVRRRRRAAAATAEPADAT